MREKGLSVKHCDEWGHRPNDKFDRCLTCKQSVHRFYRATRVSPGGPSIRSYWLIDAINEWVEYNKTFRPGYSLVVDGVLVYDSGGVDKTKIDNEIALHKKEMDATQKT